MRLNSFGAFIQKEFFHIFRDVRTMLILLVMPVVEIILFGFALTTEVNHVRVAVYNANQTAASELIVRRVDASRYFDVVKTLASPNELNAEFRSNRMDLAIIFPNDFGRDLRPGSVANIQMIADATDPNMASLYMNYAQAIIQSAAKEVQGAQAFQNPIDIEVRMLYNPQMKSAYNFVPGVMGMILMLICAMMTAISIVREKERGTMEVLLVSPIRPIFIILAKAIPYLVLSAVNYISILLLSVYVLDVPIAGSLFWLTMLSFVFVMVALSLGLLISTLVKSQVVAMLVSGMVLMMPVMILSGMIFPIDNMPLVLQWISNIIPARWYVDAARKLMIQGVEVKYVWPEFAILSGMVILLISVSLKKFKHRLE